MRQTRSLIFGAALVATTASASFAQEISLPSGLYVRGDVGAAIGEDTEFKDGFLSPTTQPSSTGNSFIFGGGIGYRFTPAFRSDITLDYIPGLNVSGHNSSASVTNRGNLSSFVALLNGYVDINGFFPNLFGRFQPYVVGGVGVAHNDLGRTSLAGTLGTLNLNGASLNSNATTHFAWGVGAGVGYALTPNWTVDLGYKYLDLGEMQSGSTLIRAAGTTAIAPVKADLQVHTVMIGLRYTFGAPPAPPPAPVAAPAAPPAPPPAAVKQEFIVFFEFDKSTLTADGQKVVDAAAAAYKKGGSAKISVAGFTDSVGTVNYNLALSQRRARTVSAALVRNGVPQDQIALSYFGKERQRVPTPDGVREPQNRRVEIDF
jgi:outer membrane protein OmpA-like peptidoglycan-associated protein